MPEEEYKKKMVNFLKGSFEMRFSDKFEDDKPCPECGGRYVHMCEEMLEVLFGATIERVLTDVKNWPGEGKEVGLFK